MAFSKVYPAYVNKAERNNRTKDEVDQIICWLTGYSRAQLARQIDRGVDFETFSPRRPRSIPTPRSSPASSAACAWRTSRTR